MKTCVWYHTSEQQPKKSGYYIAYKGIMLGDDTVDVGYYFYDAGRRQWRENSISSSIYVRVYYWSDIDTTHWGDRDAPKEKLSAAEEIAWQQVEEAIQRYETVKALS